MLSATYCNFFTASFKCLGDSESSWPVRTKIVNFVCNNVNFFSLIQKILN